MAIVDNTSYELTGAQVKDLASKIKAKADSSSLATVATSGSYNDLLDKPTIPTVNDGTLTIQQNGTTVGTFTANQSSAATVSLTDTTYSVMTGATSSTTGASGLVPAPAAGDETKVLSGAGTWVNQSGGGSSSVTYYAASDNTQGFPTYYTYLYSNSARTTVATPDTILNNFENGDTILIEYESTQTGSSAYKMTLAVETVAKVGEDSYLMNTSEINVDAGDYNQVETQFRATWDGQSLFNGRWILVRNPMPVVNNGTLTIQHNGTTKGTFTANQSTASTVNIETATKTSDLTNNGDGTTGSAYVATTDTSTVSTNMIADGAVTSAKIDVSTVMAAIYPVGSIYMSATMSTAAQVEAAFGGTWVAWGAGRVPVGVDTSQTEFDTVEETGGEKTHTLTTTEIPSHNHNDLNWATDSYHTSIDSGAGNGIRLSTAGNNIAYTDGKFRTGYTGGGAAHNNVQPYITCYMYKRTA